MPRESFERELQRIQGEVLILGSMVEEALTQSVETLRRRDKEGSLRLIERDAVINQNRFAIEHDALALIATQQPMAGDLRVLAAVLEIATELERIGDYAKGVGRINIMIADGPLLKPLIDLPLMAAKAREMLHRALEAFANRDVELALTIPRQDNEIDARYNQVYRELVAFVLIDPGNIDQTNYLLWVAHNLERSADRATNICERVVFMVTGQMSEMDVDDEEIVSLPSIA